MVAVARYERPVHAAVRILYRHALAAINRQKQKQRSANLQINKLR